MPPEIKLRAWHRKLKVMLFVGDKYGTTHPLDCALYAREGQPVDRDLVLTWAGDYLRCLLENKQNKDIVGR